MSTEEVKIGPHTMGLHCREETDFSGDSFSASNLVIFVMDDNSEIYHCYTREEFDNFLRAELQKNICIQKPNSAQKDEAEPVMREPGSQVWLDRSILAYKDGNSFFVYLREKNVPLRSEFGVSTFHGTPYDIYSVIPIENKNVLEMDVGVLKNEMREKIGKNKEQYRNLTDIILRGFAENEGLSIEEYINELRASEEDEEEEDDANHEFVYNEDNNSVKINTNEEYIPEDILDWINTNNPSELEIIDCPNLRIIPVVNSVTHLMINYCESLTGIPAFPNVSNLSLSNLPNLTSIDNQPVLTDCHIEECLALRQLPIFPNVSNIKLEGVSISSIPIFPRISILDITSAPILNIPSFPRVLSIFISNCNTLIQIEENPTVELLVIFNCSNFMLIKPCKNLLNLSMQNCPLFTNLHTMRILEDLEIENSGIVHIHFQPRLKKLSLKDCLELLEIPYISGLEELECINLPRVSYVPRISTLTSLKCENVRGCFELPL